MPKRSTPGVSTWAPSIISATRRPRATRDARGSARATGDGWRVVAEVEVAELGTEAPDEAPRRAVWSGAEPFSTTITS